MNPKIPGNCDCPKLHHENELFECIPLDEQNLGVNLVGYGKQMCPTEGTLFVYD